MGFFDKLSEGLRRTRESVAYSLSSEKLTDDFYDELEERLILADTGAQTASALVGELRERVAKKHILDAPQALGELRALCAERLAPDRELDFSGSPAVVLLIGVNGAGKTTTAGKLANLYKKEGKSVLLAAADTFRAAAVEQLEIWAARSGVDIVTGANDPAAVVFDAVSRARARGVDIVIADTAGRLHTKKNLMEELSRMARTVKKAAPEASVETLLVLDAVTGQNAVNQAAAFADAAAVSGIVLTKLDGTAKGGSVISVKEKLGIPVRYIGVGEGIDDLDRFVPEEFCAALFGAEDGK
ncbi:MAG: signal recognition particle-docking protein FtsY [Oscillospiraceae bacterium]|nr:signal recognition particle-docking protein FtsY [Oscillospiraceae bacterium]